LELVGGAIYVTARQDDPTPKRALLLRTRSDRTDWEVWDITPPDPAGKPSALDHPGGFQSDGKHLWIPLAESRRNGRSLICAFALASLRPGRPLQPIFQFPAADHIGAIAVSTNHQRLVGASWDTETVYIWDLDGKLRQTIAGAALEPRRLGFGPGHPTGAGLAVQDWKMTGDRLFASGLSRANRSEPGAPRSRLLIFKRFLEPAFELHALDLPQLGELELAQEGMAVADGVLYFLPEDLGASNRLFRLHLPEANHLVPRDGAGP
jgi:hypothetical protein